MDELDDVLGGLTRGDVLAEVADAERAVRAAQATLDGVMDERARLAVEALEAGCSYGQIAAAAGVSRPAVQGWERRHSRRHN